MSDLRPDQPKSSRLAKHMSRQEEEVNDWFNAHGQVVVGGFVVLCALAFIIRAVFG